MTHPAEDVREALLNAAEELLAGSPDGEISTRAVCDAVGVTQPVLYRIFRDKQGLLDALAEVGLQRYAARKQGLEVTSDPAADLRAGWDDHMAFAIEHPAIYRLMFSPRPGVHSAARDGVLELVRHALRRCAAAGVLRTELDAGAAMILSANIGLAMNRLTQPDVYGAPELSDLMRDAVFAAVLTEPLAPSEDAPLAIAARQLSAHLELGAQGRLAPEEQALLSLWLQRLTR